VHVCARAVGFGFGKEEKRGGQHIEDIFVGADGRFLHGYARKVPFHNVVHGEYCVCEYVCICRVA